MVIIIWLSLVILTVIAAVSRGRDWFGWLLLGCLLPLFSLIAVLILPSRKNAPTPRTHVKCPDCKELVLKEANICKHCGCRLVPTP
jgi:hypothetical protein